jgi:hypothetical protein
LLGNDSVNTFPQDPKRPTIGRLLVGNGSVNTPKTIRDNRRQGFFLVVRPEAIKREDKREQTVVRSLESSVEEEFI